MIGGSGASAETIERALSLPRVGDRGRDSGDENQRYLDLEPQAERV